MRFKEIINIILEGYREANAEFSQVSPDAPTTIAKFKELVDRNQVNGDERNIDYWRKRGWDEFNAFVQKTSSKKSITQIKRSKDSGSYITLVRDSDWTIIVPLNKDASCHWGKNSDWCTTKRYQSYFENYFYKDGVTLIYCFNTSNEMWAIAASDKVGEMEFFNQQDDSLDQEEFEDETGLSADDLRSMAFNPENSQLVQQARTEYKAKVEETSQLLKSGDVGQNSEQLEELLSFTKESEQCADYINSLYLANNRQPVTPPKEIVMAALPLYGRILDFVTNATADMINSAAQPDTTIMEYVLDSPKWQNHPDIEKWIIKTENNRNAQLYVEMRYAKNNRKPVKVDDQLAEMAAYSDIHIVSKIDNPNLIRKIGQHSTMPLLKLLTPQRTEVNDIIESILSTGKKNVGACVAYIDSMLQVSKELIPITENNVQFTQIVLEKNPNYIFKFDVKNADAKVLQHLDFTIQQLITRRIDASNGGRDGDLEKILMFIGNERMMAHYAYSLYEKNKQPIELPRAFYIPAIKLHPSYILHFKNVDVDVLASADPYMFEQYIIKGWANEPHQDQQLEKLLVKMDSKNAIAAYLVGLGANTTPVKVIPALKEYAIKAGWTNAVA